MYLLHPLFSTAEICMKCFPPRGPFAGFVGKIVLFQLFLLFRTIWNDIFNIFTRKACQKAEKLV